MSVTVLLKQYLQSILLKCLKVKVFLSLYYLLCYLLQAMVDVNVRLDKENPRRLKVPQRMCSKDFCRQASALYGQSSNSVEIVDFSDAIEDDGEYKFEDGAEFKLGNKETVVSNTLRSTSLAIA